MTRIKCLFILALIIAYPYKINAQNSLSTSEAQALAQQLWPASRDGHQVPTTLAYAIQDDGQDHPYYYIFNRGEDQGFVIISADSRNKKILAYSTSGHFDIEHAAPEMKAWLGGYEQSLRELSQVSDSLLRSHLQHEYRSRVNSRADESIAESVLPLLGEIQYAQEWPYNALCPKDCVTGCVATGAVQIMRYHQHPTMPSGKTHSYSYNGQDLSVQYNKPYNWAEMLTSYSQPGNNAQNQAIAQLMYEAGVACNMAYSPDASNASPYVMASALYEYFGYDIDMTIFRRDVFSQADFVRFLKQELSYGRPVLMFGSGNGLGHCFVCDGYDANGLFHFNWGWNGLNDGYYEITNLCPPSISTGGGSGHFNDEVGFVAGIRPAQSLQRHNNFICLSGAINCPDTITQGIQSKLTLGKVRCCTVGEFNGQLGVALYREGEYYRGLGANNVSMKSASAYSRYAIRFTMPSNIPDGEYQLIIVYRANGESNWHPMLSASANMLTCTLKNGHAICSPSNQVKAPDIYFDKTLSSGSVISKGSTLDFKPLMQGSLAAEIEQAEGNPADDGTDAESFYGL